MSKKKIAQYRKVIDYLHRRRTQRSANLAWNLACKWLRSVR